jgi:sigma-54-specific transcriptional regulator
MKVFTLPNPGAHSLTVRAKALVFEDTCSRELLRQIRQIAPSEATVLIVGETGTGKEIVARYVHELSRRVAGPFAAINCGAFADSLVDAELFGHERGAFTGATSSKSGWFETAQGGTLFLDEIGDLPLLLQVKLLRVLQEREIVRLGSRQAIPIDVRLVAATNVDLEAAVRAGRFREDLYFRLNVATLRIPPLRERPGDILPLAEHFLRVYGQRAGLDQVALSGESVQQLLDHSWPGNVRELENVIHRGVLTCQDGRIEVADLPLSSGGKTHQAETPRADKAALLALERVLIQMFEQGGPELYERINTAVVTEAYRFCHENQVQAAHLLGISRNVLRARLAQGGLIAGRGTRRDTQGVDGLPPQAPAMSHSPTSVPAPGGGPSPH